jgi:hypothetical protein
VSVVAFKKLVVDKLEVRWYVDSRESPGVRSLTLARKYYSAKK